MHRLFWSGMHCWCFTLSYTFLRWDLQAVFKYFLYYILTFTSQKFECGASLCKPLQRTAGNTWIRSGSQLCFMEDQRKCKNICLRAKWTPLFELFLYISIYSWGDLRAKLHWLAGQIWLVGRLLRTPWIRYLGPLLESGLNKNDLHVLIDELRTFVFLVFFKYWNVFKKIKNKENHFR